MQLYDPEQKEEEWKIKELHVFIITFSQWFHVFRRDDISPDL